MRRIVFFICFIILNLIPDLIMVDINLNQPTLILLYSAMFIFIIVFIRKKYNDQLNTYNPNGFGKNPLSKKLILFLLGMLFINELLILILNYFIQNISSNQQTIIELIGLKRIITFLRVVIYGPILEEYIFRGIFFNYFFNKNNFFSNFLAVFVSGIVFALAHEVSLSLNLLLYCIGGWIFGITYMYTKDIRYSIALHSIHNLIPMLILINIF